MPYTLKTQQIAVKDPDTGVYSGVDILAEQTTEGLLTEIIATGNEVKTDVAAQMATERSDFNTYVSGKEAELDQYKSTTETNINTYVTNKNQEIATMIADADEDVSDLEDRKQDVATAVSGMLSKGVDNSLTTANVPAESKAVGDLFETIVEGKSTQPNDKWNRLWIKPSASDYEIPTMDDLDEVSRQISDVEMYNSWDILPEFATLTSGTSRTVKFTWDSNKTSCTVSGTADGGEAKNNIYNAFIIPDEITSGKTYRVLYSTTDENIVVVFVAYLDGETSGGISTTITGNTLYTFPSNITGLTIKLSVASGQSVNGTAKLAILSTASNAELDENIKELDADINAIKGTIVPKSANETTLADTIADDVLVLNDSYNSVDLFGKNALWTKGGVLRNDGTRVFPKEGQGGMPAANAPKNFLNAVIRSYCGNENLNYGNSGTLFSPTCTNNIDCSSFVTAVLYGVFYNNSRYVGDSNILRYHTDDDVIGDTGVESRPIPYTIAEHYAKMKRFYKFQSDAATALNMLEYGDLIFGQHGSFNGLYYNIGHVMFVLGRANDRLIVAHAGGGSADYKAADFNDTTVKVTAFNFTDAAIENYFVGFARPNYSYLPSQREENVINGNDMVLGIFWNSGQPTYSVTWCGSQHFFPVNSGSSVNVLSKSENSKVTVTEFSNQMVFIKNSAVTTSLRLTENTSFIAVNYGYYVSDNIVPTLEDLAAFKMRINQT